MDLIFPSRRTLRFALALTLAFAAGARISAAAPPTIEQIGYTPISAPNACLPDSVGFRSAYQSYQQSRNQSPWSRILVVYRRNGAAIQAHAYCVFSADGKLWTYDQVGGTQPAPVSDTEKDNAEKLGRRLAANSFARASWADSML